MFGISLPYSMGAFVELWEKGTILAGSSRNVDATHRIRPDRKFNSEGCCQTSKRELETYRNN